MSEKLDKIDLTTLSILQDNARTPFTRIAEELGISDATIHLRVKKMEEMGLIEGYTVILNQEEMGKSVIAYILIRVEPGSIEEVCTKLTELDDVYEVAEIHERYDILVKVRGSNLEQIRETLIKKIRLIPEVVGSETYTVFKNWKRDMGVKIES